MMKSTHYDFSVEAFILCKEILKLPGEKDFCSSDGQKLGVVMFSSHTKYPILWNAEANIHGRESFICSCVFKRDTQSIFDNLWGLRTETSLSLHLAVKKSRKILVRKSWIRSGSRSSSQSRGESKFVDSFGSKGVHSADLRGACSPGTFSRSDQPVEEPWLLESSVPSQSVRQRVASSGLTSEDKSLKPHISGGFPVEEPWLFQQSHVFHDSISEMNSEISENEVSIESRVALKGSVARVLLINSSLCTMQRVAVLEDEKLVEILLEPVINEVQAGSVYLGIVKQLLPHMQGAFVNIGSSKHSLLNIKRHRKLFIFPSFSPARKLRCVNGSSLDELQELVQVDTDDPVENMHDDFGQHEMENEVEVSDDLSKDVNGSVIVYAFEPNAKRHLDRPTGSFYNSQPQTMSDLSVGTESSGDAKYLCVQDRGSDWKQVKEGTKIIVQVVKEKLDTKGPKLTPYPDLESRFWILRTGSNKIGISEKICGVERPRLREIARHLQPPGFGLIVRTAAAGHAMEELRKDLDGLLSTWEGITKQATAAALAADEGVEDAVPVMLHRAMGQTLSVVQDYFNDKVKRMVVDSQRTYHEVTNYLQEIDPDLCDRVELYSKSNPLFDEYNIEEEFNNMLNKRVPLSSGGDLVIEQTEALVSIDVNGGRFMLRNGTSMAKAVLDVNLEAAKEIARQIRLRDIGGIIVVDFIDMLVDSHRRDVYREVKNAVVRDRSVVKVSELSKNGMMEITRQRVRPSVTDMLSEKCTCCHGTRRVEALEISFSKIEREICRLLALMDQRPDPEKPKSWPTFILRVDQNMCDYLTSSKTMTLAMLRNSLNVRFQLKVDKGFSRGVFKLEPLTDNKDGKNEDQGATHSLQPLKIGNISSRKVNIFPKTGETSSRKVNIFPKKWKARGI